MIRRIAALGVGLVLLFALVVPVTAQRGRGSFGGGGRSFGGGGFSRSSGGGSFGGGRSFGSLSSGSGSFGGAGRSSGSFGAPRASSSFGTTRSSGSSSFGRTGSFGSSGRINSTSLSSPVTYRGTSYSTRSTIFYNGGYYPAYGGGFWAGYSIGMLSSPWTHWMPFYPAFYVDPPYYENGNYYAGGFSFTRFLFGLIIIVFIFWLIARLFRGGSGGGRVKYTVYR